MAILKQYLKTKPLCKVTFTVAAKEAKTVVVVGDFNNWDSDKNVLKKMKNGNFKGAMNLPKGSSYEFRYLVDGQYLNENEADRYQWNDFAGTENAVIDL